MTVLTVEPSFAEVVASLEIQYLMVLLVFPGCRCHMCFGNLMHFGPGTQMHDNFVNAKKTQALKHKGTKTNGGI